jgi:hypothetical protein
MNTKDFKFFKKAASSKVAKYLVIIPLKRYILPHLQVYSWILSLVCSTLFKSDVQKIQKKSPNTI